jgi:hypothetical protein
MPNPVTPPVQQGVSNRGVGVCVYRKCCELKEFEREMLGFLTGGCAKRISKSGGPGQPGESARTLESPRECGVYA